MIEIKTKEQAIELCEKSGFIKGATAISKKMLTYGAEFEITELTAHKIDNDITVYTQNNCFEVWNSINGFKAEIKP
jgi:hypothetical protein